MGLGQTIEGVRIVALVTKNLAYADFLGNAGSEIVALVTLQLCTFLMSVLQLT